MPKIAEAAVAVAGLVVGVEVVTEFGTDKYDGKKVLVAAASGGYVSVKLRPEIVDQIHPEFGQSVAWWVRYGAYANRERQTDAQATCAFVAPVQAADLGQFEGAVSAQVKKAA